MRADRLALQKEILAANGDPYKLAAIANRLGLDPGLWEFFRQCMYEVEKVEDDLVEAAEYVRDAAELEDDAHLTNALEKLAAALDAKRGNV